MAAVPSERLYDLLPNGLHDADLRSFAMDYTLQQLSLDVVAWVSEGEQPRELYRPAHVTFGGVSFLVVEPPRDRTELDVKQSVWIDAGVLDAQHDLVANLDIVGPINYVFLRDFNSFMFFSADSVQIEWTGPAYVRS
jgi:hypothetical protein